MFKIYFRFYIFRTNITALCQFESREKSCNVSSEIRSKSPPFKAPWNTKTVRSIIILIVLLPIISRTKKWEIKLGFKTFIRMFFLFVDIKVKLMFLCLPIWIYIILNRLILSKCCNAVLRNAFSFDTTKK